MACLNSLDLIAYAGGRHVDIFEAPTAESFRTSLKNALAASGWTVEIANTGLGTGFKCTSKKSPWCAPGGAPPDYVGKCRVWFNQRPFSDDTQFFVMNESETMAQTSSEIRARPTTGSYAGYKYFFVGTNFDFKLFMLGIKDRLDKSIPNANTAVLCGVPQIPGFLQKRTDPLEWPDVGANEMFYCVDASQMRANGLVNNFRDWFGGISTAKYGPFVCQNPPGVRFGFQYTYGVDGGEPFNTGTTFQSGYWVYNPDSPATPDNWHGLFWPPIIAWQSEQADTTTKRLKGFGWDQVIVNKALPGDAIVRTDSHEFIVFNHNWQGEAAPFQPPGALLIVTAGTN